LPQGPRRRNRPAGEPSIIPGIQEGWQGDHTECDDASADNTGRRGQQRSDQNDGKSHSTTHPAQQLPHSAHHVSSNAAFL